jgi:hypothetical protein
MTIIITNNRMARWLEENTGKYAVVGGVTFRGGGGWELIHGSSFRGLSIGNILHFYTRVCLFFELLMCVKFTWGGEPQGTTRLVNTVMNLQFWLTVNSESTMMSSHRLTMRSPPRWWSLRLSLMSAITPPPRESRIHVSIEPACIQTALLAWLCYCFTDSRQRLSLFLLLVLTNSTGSDSHIHRCFQRWPQGSQESFRGCQSLRQ